MPPKKNKKPKGRRYSCDLCSEIDNAKMIKCDQCESKYHLKCLNIEPIDENEEWICFECLKRDLSRPPKPNYHGKPMQSPSKQTNDPNHIDAGHQVNEQEKHESNAGKNHSFESQSQVRSTHSSMRKSETTHSSVRRRTQLELDRLEEERHLKEKRDKEYLDNKYRILIENCNDRSGSERRSTDRSSFTREWLRNQSVEVQPPSTSSATLMDEKDDERMPWHEIEEFGRRIGEITFEKTSPPDLDQKSSSLARQTSQLKHFALPKGVTTYSERRQTQSSSAEPNGRDIHSMINRQRIPCPVHDARGHMFQSGSNITGIPCSNSTFVLPQSSEDQVAEKHRSCLRIRSISPDSMNHNTLEWDNYVGTQSDMRRIPQPQPNQQQVKLIGRGSLPGKNSDLDTERYPHLNPRFVTTKSGFESFGQAKSSHRTMEPMEPIQATGYRPKVKNRNSNDDAVYVVNDSPTFESRQPDFNEDTLYVTNDQSTSNRRSTSDQNYRKVEFEEPERLNRDLSNLLSVENQPNTSYAPTFRTDGSIVTNQIAARHVVEKKLPIFDGDPNEWPIWYNKYKNSTALCGFTNGENLDRLEKCLRGKARDKVKGRLIHPESVPWIIETLEMLYGRPEVIIKAIIIKIRDHPIVKPDKLDELMDFAFEVQTICATMESMECIDHLKDPMLIEDLVDKLPIQEKKEWARYKAGKPHVTIRTLSVWLYDLAKLLSTVATPRATKSNDRKPEKEKSERNEKAIGLERVNVHVNQTSGEVDNRQRKQQSERNQQKKFPCPICNNECDKIENCSKFKSFTVDARWKTVNEHKLCRRCLRKHRSPCRATNVCGKNSCQYKHHFLLHNDERHSPPRNNSTANTTVSPSNFHAVMNVSTMLRIVPVILYNGIKSVATFAFLDEGTTVTMMEKRLADELGLNGTSEQICLIWTKEIHRRERAERVSLEISGIDGFNKRYELKGVRTVDELHLPSQTINKAELITKYQYLRDIPLVDYNNAIPGIMIGSDMPKFGTQLQVIESEDVENDEFNGPMASRTRLGWSVHGPRNEKTTNEHANVHQFEICPHHNESDDEIHQRVKEHFSVENFGVQANSKLNLESKDNERALEMLNRLTRKINGRYETGLLWKSDNFILPNSLPMALKRLVSLERQGPEIIQSLGAKVADYVAKGYARKLSQKDLDYRGPVWYLPLFGVVHPKKPGKIRMVFDAAAKVNSVSLNSALLKGPDLYTSLIDILRRFRERFYTGGGDIAEMYHQVAIIEKDRNFQRFLFREDNTKKPDIYEMDVMTFGANCSPCSAQFVKNKNAAQFKETHPRVQ